MSLTFLTTPSSRLRTFMAPGTAALLVAVVWALQPATGFTANLAAWRVVHIDPAVWVCLAVGFGAYMVSVWIWALKPHDSATRLFALSGVMTLLFTFAATRSFMAAPLPQGVTEALETTNLLGASGFGIVMICLFLIYPVRLPFWRWTLTAAVLVFGAWTLVRACGPLRQPVSVQLITFCEMLGIILFAAWQILASRHDPRHRAIAVWLGISVLLGAGGFIVTVSLPIVLGGPPLIRPYYAFASFLLIYAGLAIGLVRYRLFDLGGWAFHLIFHTAIALIVLAVDAILIASLSLAPGTALAIALFALAFVYMPLREQVWRRLTRRRDRDDAETFRGVMEAALQPSGPRRAQSWEQLLRDIYDPLDLTPSPQPVPAPRLDAEGLELHLPAVAAAPPLILRYAHGGRTLFTQRDRATAQHIVALMRHAEESRGAYDRGVNEERTRIARDIHDNIGAQLLRALHSSAADRKDAMIRDTLADLRDVINNAQHEELSLVLVLADLRAETADRLDPHGVTLDWRAEAEDGAVLAPPVMHALRSLIREAVSNTVKYAGATAMTVVITVDDAALTLHIADNGRGFDRGTIALGHGLDNMKARAESLGGTFTLTSSGAGTRLTAALPNATRETRP